MKFLNHLDFNENEARKMKMFRTTTSYTPSPAAAGNIILDTAANIPKWWDGTAWRDFSYGTAGTMNWNIQSDSGSNIQVDTGETLDIAGGNKISTVTSGSATAPVVTINHDTQSQSNTTATAETIYDQSAWTSVTGVTRDSYGHVTGIETTVHTLEVSAYDVQFADITVGSNTGEVALKLVGTNPNALASAVVKGGTNINVDEVNGELVINTTGLSANTNTQATYTIPVSAGAGNTAVVTLTGGGAASTTETLTFAGTTNEVAVTESTGNNGTVTIGLPDDVTIGNDLTVTTDASVGGNLVVTGNLDVNGTTTTLDTTNTSIKDNIIVLNSGATGSFGSSGTSGLEIERGASLPHAQFLWNDSTHKWTVSEGNASLSFSNVIQNLFATATGNSGTATANSVTTALSIVGSNGISTSGSGQTITIDGSGVGNQNLYATFIGDSGTTTASSTTDTLDIEGGTGITTTATNDKVSVAFDVDNSGLDIFKTVQVQNTTTAGTVATGATAAVADTPTDTLTLKGVDASMALTSADNAEVITFKSSVLVTTKQIVSGSLNTETLKAKITHGFGTQDVIVQLWDVTTKEMVHANVWNYETNNNSILVQFSARPSNNIKVVVMAMNLDAGSTISYPTS
tara:strand:- start:2965 stop:4854 length:1890 start_codon:yes stop_codon:yes gene_type:complete